MYDTPDAVIGDVPDSGLAKIFRNVAKCASGMISFECVDAVVDGTLRSPFESSASACVFVVRYLTRSHAWSVLLAVLRDADDRPVDVAGAVQLRLGVVDGHRRRAVVELRMLGLR